MIGSYVKIALKVLRRRKFFTFISLFGIGFTLLVLVVVTAMLDELLAPREPEVHLARTLVVSYACLRGEDSRHSGSPGYGLLDKYGRGIEGVETTSIFSTLRQSAVYVKGEKIELQVRRTDGPYWDILRFQFLEGRPVAQEDDDNGMRVTVITESTRKRLFGEGSALGKTVDLGGDGFTVVGVVEDVPFFRTTAYADVWIPNSASAAPGYRDQLMGGFNAMLLAENRGATPRIQDEFRSRMTRVEFTNDRYGKAEAIPVTRLHEVSQEVFAQTLGDSSTGPFLLILAGGAFLFMLLPAINLVNINVSRIVERSSEIGVRKAFGASSAHLVGQFVVENVILCLIGGAIGLLGAVWILALINDGGWIANAAFRLNGRVFLAGLLLAGFFGVLSGVYPAWRMSRLHPVEALKGGGA